jgi:retron-type reverse transcriptase
VEGDISKCFDNINQTILMDFIKNKVSDQAFIDLMYKNFKVGYGVIFLKLVRDKNGIL